MVEPETFVAGLKSEESRKVLAETLLAAFDRWGLTQQKQAALLGLPDMSTLMRGEPLPENPDVLERTGHLLAIDRALVRLYRDDVKARDAWLMFSYSELGGQSLLALMLAGLDGIKEVRKFIESQLDAMRTL